MTTPSGKQKACTEHKKSRWVYGCLDCNPEPKNVKREGLMGKPKKFNCGCGIGPQNIHEHGKPDSHGTARPKKKPHLINEYGDCVSCGMLAVEADGSYCPAKINKYIDSKLTSEGRA